MLRHDDVSHDDKMVTLAGFFEEIQEAVTAAWSAQLRHSAITRAGDKVQVMSAVGAMEPGRHSRDMVPAAVVPALAKNARPALSDRVREGVEWERGTHVSEWEWLRAEQDGPPATTTHSPTDGTKRFLLQTDAVTVINEHAPLFSLGVLNFLALDVSVFDLRD